MPKSNPKIILIGTSASSMLHFRRDLINNLLSKNIHVYSFICEYKAEELTQLEELGVTPITYTMARGGLNPFADLKAIKELTNKIKAIQPEIVFSFFAKPVVYGTLAARKAKVPKVYGMLEGLGYFFTDQPKGKSFKTKLVQKIQIFLYKIAIPKLDALILLNPDDKKDLLISNNIKAKEVHILGGIGLNLEQYRYSTAPIDPINFLFIGRLLREKGIFEFIDAVKKVKKQHPNAKFTVIGSIDPQNMGALSQQELDQLIEENLFEYPGYVNNIQDWIKESSVFVLPSYREGVPRSTQEAMAIGRPVITTDVPGCRETIIDGVNGFLVPKWNPEALAEKMIYFIESPEQINVMGKKSYKIAIEKFDANKVNNKLLHILGLEEQSYD